MKKDRLVSRVEDGKHSLKYNLDVEDAVDTRVYDMSTTGKLPHMFPCHMEEDGGARIFTYKIGDKVPAQEFLKKEVNKPQMLTLLYNLLAGLEDFGLNMVSLSYVAKDVQYIYVTPENQEVSFVVVPVNKETTDLNEVRQLVKDIIAGARYFEMDRDNYVAKLISFLNRPGTFSLGDMKKYVEQMLLEIGIDIAAINKNKQEQIKAAEKANADAGKVSRLGVMMNNARMNENVQAPMPQGRPAPMPQNQNRSANFGQPAPMPQGQPGFGQAPMPLRTVQSAGTNATEPEQTGTEWTGKLWTAGTDATGTAGLRPGTNAGLRTVQSAGTNATEPEQTGTEWTGEFWTAGTDATGTAGLWPGTNAGLRTVRSGANAGFQSFWTACSGI